jgi:hypothetical protein
MLQMTWQALSRRKYCAWRWTQPCGNANSASGCTLRVRIMYVACANFKKPPLSCVRLHVKNLFSFASVLARPRNKRAPAVCEIGIDLCRSNKSRKLADKFFICGAVIWVKNCDTPRDTSSNHYYYSRVFRMRRRRRGCCCACERVNARAARQR